MTTTTDLTPLVAALDAREWDILNGYSEDVADALLTVVNRGASDAEIERLLRGYSGDDRLLRRVPAAARHLRRQREAG